MSLISTSRPGKIRMEGVVLTGAGGDPGRRAA
jgi:hypothetical protein